MTQAAFDAAVARRPYGLLVALAEGRERVGGLDRSIPGDEVRPLVDVPGAHYEHPVADAFAYHSERRRICHKFAPRLDGSSFLPHHRLDQRWRQ